MVKLQVQNPDAQPAEMKGEAPSEEPGIALKVADSRPVTPTTHVQYQPVLHLVSIRKWPRLLQTTPSVPFQHGLRTN